MLELLSDEQEMRIWALKIRLSYQTFRENSYAFSTTISTSYQTAQARSMGVSVRGM